VDGNGQTIFHDGNWRRRVLIGLGICGGLLLIFHRPLLLGLGHRIALHYAAKENLKLEFQLEGSVFTNLIVRNLHAASTGASDVESIDVDLARIDYGLFTLLRHGLSTAIKNAVIPLIVASSAGHRKAFPVCALRTPPWPAGIRRQMRPGRSLIVQAKYGSLD